MLGERYFTNRQRLAHLITATEALGVETGTQLAEALPTREPGGALGPPFLFVVCGETNAGKSAFFNGLFGELICPMSNLPETDRVVWYRFGDPASDTEVTPLLREAYRPIPLLKDFNLIDTPGLQAAPTEASRIAERLVGAADALFVVVPVNNPWGAPAWNLISRLPPEALDRVILIVQQCDRADAADLGVIQGHLKDLAVKRVGRELPVFTVSAKLAYDAKHAGEKNTDRMVSSGYLALEAFLSQRVFTTPGRVELLGKWRGQAAGALRLIEDRLDAQGRGMRQHGAFLQEVEGEIVRLREHFIGRLPQHLKSVAEVFQLESVGVARFLRRRLGVFRSLFRVLVGDQTSQAVEAEFIERMKSTVEAVAKQDGDEVVAVCRGHRAELDRRVRDQMGVELGEGAGCEEGLERARAWFVERVGRVAREGIGNLKVRNQLGKDLLLRNHALKSFVFVTLLLVTAAGVCGALAVPWVPFGLLGAAGAFFLAGLLVAWLARRRVVADFQERMLDTCGGFASTLKSDYEEALRVVFQEYLETLAPIRRHLVAAQSELEPRQQKWKDLFLTLKAIEQDL
ncbi:MAG: 50S ribosome-binding GTPase [Verrucomicrobia bacterium]|nr:50S ribosome-binding GTPase [Verrucomicrobiota bacterium]